MIFKLNYSATAEKTVSDLAKDKPTTARKAIPSSLSMH